LNIFKKLLSLTTPSEKRKLLAFTLLLLVFVIVETFTIGLIVPLLDSLGSYEDGLNNQFFNRLLSYFGLPVKGLELVYTLTFVYFVFTCLKSFLHILVLKFTASIPYEIFYNKSSNLIQKYYDMEWSEFTRVNSNEVIKKTTKSNEMAAYAYVIALQFMTALFVVFFLSSMLLVHDPLITSGLVAVLGSIVFIIFSFMKSVQKKAGIERELRLSGVFKTASESILSMKDQRVIGVEHFFFDRFLSESRELSKALKKVTYYPPTQLVFIEFFGILILISVITFLLINQIGIASVLPTFVFYAFAFRRIIPSMGLVSSLSMTLKNLESSVDIVYDELKHNLPNRENVSPQIQKQENRLIPSWRQISFRDLSYSYDGSTNALSNINIDFKRQLKTSIVGESGSGKSTLIDLFTGLSTPTKGQILIDGTEVSDLSILRGTIGYVPQMLNILDESLINNITFGRVLDTAQLDRVIEIADLKKVIDELENGLEEILGERGVRLSGGQRQRIAIARALYSNPEIIVFDEATSALDNISEKYISDMINILSKDKTIISVAHRLTTIRDFDVIYLLEEGKISSSGSHEELMLSSDLYRKMNNA